VGSVTPCREAPVDCAIGAAYSCHLQLKTRTSIDHSLQGDAEALHGALANLVRAYQFRDRDRICCHDVSVTQCYALEALITRGPMRLGALAERLFLDKSTASRVVDALVRKGYGERLGDASDGRALSLHATSHGRELFQRIHAELIREQEELIADLTPVARRAAITVITRLASTAERKFGLADGPCCGPRVRKTAA